MKKTRKKGKKGKKKEKKWGNKKRGKNETKNVFRFGFFSKKFVKIKGRSGFKKKKKLSRIFSPFLKLTSKFAKTRPMSLLPQYCLVLLSGYGSIARIILRIFDGKNHNLRIFNGKKHNSTNF